MTEIERYVNDISGGFTGILKKAGAFTVIVEARRMPATGILWKEDAVMTANHAVKREKDIKVVLSDGREVSAELAGRDPVSDLAVLKLSGRADAAATWQEKEAELGQIVFSLARSREEGLQATFGIVGTVAGPMHTWPGGIIERYIQTDGTRYLGFSGGPLVNTMGEAAGINVYAGPGRIPLTLPAHLAQRTAADLLEHGSRKTAFLGINSQAVELDPSLRGSSGSGPGSGLLVTAVDRDSPAGKAGLTVGDIILKAGDTQVVDHNGLLRMLMENKPGDTLSLAIIRGGKPESLTVVLGERPFPYERDRCGRP
ncbi:MAG: PDZ domain-containing protein [Spirochaetales bacterium]|nr:MAG: PDZ domain-containing protein [Spirochaetales bacterium]